MAAVKEELQSVAKYFGLSNINVVLDGGSKEPTIHSAGNKTVRGHATIVKHLARTSHLDHLLGTSAEERAAIEQWIEYRICFIDRCSSDKDVLAILEELNAYLSDKVYFVSNRLSLADIVVFHGLHCIINDMSHQEKEKFIHISRWFSNLQQDDRLRQDLKYLNFQKTHLYTNCQH